MKNISPLSCPASAILFPQEATFWPWLSQSPAVLPVVLPHWSAIFCSVRSRNNCINFCLPQFQLPCPTRIFFCCHCTGLSCDISETSIQLMVQASIKEISQRLSIPPYHLDLSCGNLYHHLSDLQYSYLEAQKAQSRRRFYQDEDIEDSSDLFLPITAILSLSKKFCLLFKLETYLRLWATHAKHEHTLQMQSRYSGTAQQYRSFFRTLFELADTLRMGDRKRTATTGTSYLRAS